MRVIVPSGMVRWVIVMVRFVTLTVDYELFRLR
jgi:hypothetical protein